MVVKIKSSTGRTLTDVLLSKRISDERKEKALGSAARALAKLHATGRIHTIPHTNSFIISRDMNARLIRAIRTRRAESASEIEDEKQTFIHKFGIEIGMNYRQIQQEYERQYAKSTAQPRRRT